MTSLELAAIEQPGFTAAASQEPEAISVRLSGTADGLVHTQLDRYLKELHLEACRLGAPEVNVDVTGLNFINSSCLMLFVTWVMSMRDLEAERQYRLVLSSGTKQQRRAFAVLANVAVGLVTIQ
jgi:hypothetical protein